MHIAQSDFHDHLMRGLAHKMNNILSLFHGYVGLLLDNKKLDPAVVDGLARIEQGAQAASELMDRAKSLARPSSVILREIDLAEFLDAFKTTLRLELRNDAKVKITCEKGMPRVQTDVSRLKSALVELVRNACEASPGKGTVHLKAYVRAGGKGGASPENEAAKSPKWIFFDVTDRGPGVPTENGQKIFQPFFTTKHKEGSIGLGLTVAIGLMQQLDGSIRFDSKPGRTTFQIRLPLAK